MAFLTHPRFRARLALGVPLVGFLLAASCADDPDDCAKTNDCIDRAGNAGQAGSGGQTGGTAGSGGTRAGSGGSGGSAGQGASGGQGATGATSGQGGSAGGGDGGVSGSAQGGADPGGAGAGGEDNGGTDTGGTDMGGAGMGGAGMGGAGMGGAGMGGAGMGGAGTGPVDTTPPYVVSVSPVNNATGVTNDQNIVITFSEAMDAAATEGAYQSNDLPLGGTTRSWSSDGRVLTLDPTTLFYDSGTDPAVVQAKLYSLAISTGARDRAGNQMTQSYNWSFRTLRRITQTLRPVANTQNPSEYWAFTRVALVPAGASLCPNSVRLGSFAMTPYRYFGVFAFQIAPLPAGITDFESATFSAKQVAGVGDPFPQNGPMLAFHVPPVPVNQGIAPQDMPVNTTPLHNLGTFSTSAATVTPMLDALASLEDDYANRTQRGNMSTYRIQPDHEFHSPTNMYVEMYVQLECGSIALTTTYLIP